MIKNYISENLEYLCKLENSTQDDFGNIFDLNRGSINSYVKNKAVPKLETIQRICLHYEISIDDFINTDLREKKYNKENKIDYVEEPKEGYGYISLKYVESLEDRVKELIIENMKNQNK